MLGGAGIGKSQVCAQVAEYFRAQLDPAFGFVDVRLSQLDPVDMRGVPFVVNGQTRWATPNFLPDCDKTPNGILFLDEINAAPPSVAAAGYQLILDRALGDYKLGDGWIILAAGNEQSDRGVTFTMPAPLANRFITIKVTTHLDDVMDRAAVMGVDPTVMAFLKVRADYLHKFDGKQYVSGEQFPTPRGWFRVSDLIRTQLDDRQRDELIHGSVGKEAGHDFVTFLKLRDAVVNFEEILNDPEHAEVPDSLNLRYMVTMMLASRMDKFNADTVYKYLRRLPREFQVMAVTLAYRRSRDITRTAMFAEYSVEIAEVLRKTAS
jgi:hypothetical protein